MSLSWVSLQQLHICVPRTSLSLSGAMRYLSLNTYLLRIHLIEGKVLHSTVKEKACRAKFLSCPQLLHPCPSPDKSPSTAPLSAPRATDCSGKPRVCNLTPTGASGAEPRPTPPLQAMRVCRAQWRTLDPATSNSFWNPV